MTPTHPIRREWQAFWLALGFLTRIPMLVRIDYSQTLMNQSSVYFPLVGLLLGGIYAALYSVLVLAFSPVTAVVAVVAFHLWLTGAFHEDGLADSADGIGGGLTVADRLRIMKDSRIGTYGTAALVMALALKVALLLDTQLIWLALLVAPAIARLAPLWLMYRLPYITDPDQSKTKPVAEGFSGIRLLVAHALVLIIALACWPWAPYLTLLAAGAVGLTCLLWGRLLMRRLGGYTGDTLGASVVFCELALLALL
ncbi:MAG: adenosylcobinamide-GDP ribazoletransferase [Marinobacter sp.]|nr:adenosylcobinamide-GDP ribazoletransferase [Marinobacter sp.]